MPADGRWDLTRRLKVKYRERGSFYDRAIKVCSSQWRRIHANRVRPANTSDMTSAHVKQHNWYTKLAATPNTNNPSTCETGWCVFSLLGLSFVWIWSLIGISSFWTKKRAVAMATACFYFDYKVESVWQSRGWMQNLQSDLVSHWQNRKLATSWIWAYRIYVYNGIGSA